jgi:hypothetical protein
MGPRPALAEEPVEPHHFGRASNWRDSPFKAVKVVLHTLLLIRYIVFSRNMAKKLLGNYCTKCTVHLCTPSQAVEWHIVFGELCINYRSIRFACNVHIHTWRYPLLSHLNINSSCTYEYVFTVIFFYLAVFGLIMVNWTRLFPFLNPSLFVILMSRFYASLTIFLAIS